MSNLAARLRLIEQKLDRLLAAAGSAGVAIPPKEPKLVEKALPIAPSERRNEQSSRRKTSRRN